MSRLLFASPPEQRLLPGGRLSGPTPWLIGIMMFVMVTVAAAGLALAGSARLVTDGLANRHSIQIADGARWEARALAAARRAPGVTAANAVPQATLRATLERWLGPDASADLPLPVLIDVELASGANPGVVEQAVRAAAPSARLISHSGRVGPMLGALRALAVVAAAIVALVALATTAAVVLATRSALEAQRATIEVMHGIGATDEQISRLFQRKIALDALVGGVAGAAVAALVLLLVSAGGLASAGDWTGGRLLGAADLAVLAALPLAGAILATLVARWTVLRALGSSL